MPCAAAGRHSAAAAPTAPATCISFSVTPASLIGLLCSFPALPLHPITVAVCRHACEMRAQLSVGAGLQILQQVCQGGNRADTQAQLSLDPLNRRIWRI